MLYFAFGSNINLAQMATRCKDAKTIGRACIKDHELEFRANKRGKGVANIRHKRGSVVWGALYEISESDRDALDRFEGHPFVYRRSPIEVYRKNQKYKAITYIMDPNFQLEMPNMDYLNRIAVGYNDFNIDQIFLDHAIERTRERFMVRNNFSNHHLSNIH